MELVGPVKLTEAESSRLALRVLEQAINEASIGNKESKQFVSDMVAHFGPVWGIDKDQKISDSALKAHKRGGKLPDGSH